MTDTDPLSTAALDAEDYLLDCMGDAVTLWEALRHPQGAPFTHFDRVFDADPWAARESVAQLVEFFQNATESLDAPSDALAEVFLRHCTNAETATQADEDDPFLECLIAYDRLPKAGELLAALATAAPEARADLEDKLRAFRDMRDA